MVQPWGTGFGRQPIRRRTCTGGVCSRNRSQVGVDPLLLVFEPNKWNFNRLDFGADNAARDGESADQRTNRVSCLVAGAGSGITLFPMRFKCLQVFTRGVHSSWKYPWNSIRNQFEYGIGLPMVEATNQRTARSFFQLVQPPHGIRFNGKWRDWAQGICSTRFGANAWSGMRDDNGLARIE